MSPMICRAHFVLVTFNCTSKYNLMYSTIIPEQQEKFYFSDSTFLKLETVILY